MLQLENLTKTLPSGKKLLDNVSFSVGKGEFVGILGASGAGKSLTIRCILGLTKACSGCCVFSDSKDRVYNTLAIKGRDLRQARRKIGVIFQGYNLVKRLTVVENVMIGRLAKISPLRSWFYGFTDKEAYQALAALDRVDMADYATRLTGSLSGGEMQRVAIARAINQNPALYIADEPISSLDPKNAKQIMKLLAPLAEEQPVIGVFHQPDMVARYCTRMIGIKDGQIIYDGEPTADRELLRDIYGEELADVANEEAATDTRQGHQGHGLQPVYGI